MLGKREEYGDMMFNYASVCIIKFRVPVLRVLAVNLGARRRNSGTRNLIARTAGN